MIMYLSNYIVANFYTINPPKPKSDWYMIMYLSNYIVANPRQSYGYVYGLRLVLEQIF